MSKVRSASVALIAISAVGSTYLTSLGSATAATPKPKAKAATKTTVKAGAKTTKGKTSGAPIAVSVQAGLPAPACTGTITTEVAGMKNTKYLASINIYAEASETNLKNSLAIGIESNNTLAFTVIKDQGDWLEVNEPIRPNGSTGWIRKADVTTFTHQYQIKIDLKARKMSLCGAGRLLFSAPVVVGADDTPTPAGTFYTLDLVKPKAGPTGAYGPFAYGLSAFSEVKSLEHWAGGDGRIAIHGTDQPQLLGSAASHGCIRVSNDTITKMTKILPLGVPVAIY